MQHLVVVAFDPGVSTGWAIVRVPVKVLLDQGQVGSTSRMKVTCGQFRTGSAGGNVERALDLMRLAYEEVAEEGDLLVCVQEGFTLRMMSKDPEMLEPVRWLAVWDEKQRVRDEEGAPPRPFAVERQDPSLVTSVMTDSRLRLWGLWFNAKEHGRAALKHALMYLRRFTQDGELRIRAGWEF